MKRIFLILLGLYVFICFAQAQQLPQYSSQSTSQIGGRYEIIMSEIAASNSFKLDRYFGNVYLLVKTKNDEPVWEKMLKDISNNDPFFSDKINYQIYMSSISLRYTFLLNVNSGTTWMLVEDDSDKKNPILWWKLMPE